MFENLINSLSVIQPWLGDSRLLFSVAIGLAVGLVVLTLMYLLVAASSPVRRRLIESRSGQEYKPTFASKVDQAVQPLKPIIIPKSDKELSSVSRRLIYAGYRGREAIATYYAIKIFLIITLAALGALAGYVFVTGSSNQILLYMFIGATLGFVLPSYVLDKKVTKRQEQIVNAFPDMLDLLVACSEAGLGLNAAMQRVSREMRSMYPDLSEEMELVNAEIGAGIDRVQALKSLSTRTGVQEISGFVSMISQSVRFGTSIAESLRIYAEVFREKRMSRAEEEAAKVATKLIFPLVLCIFPSFFVVMIGPAALEIMKAFAQIQIG